MQTAVLGGGCFWCTEAVFSELKGVQKVESGYSGGNVPNPSYEDVCTDTTGHAEVVRVTFDENVVSYADLLRVFFSTHDPTTLNRQGADTGRQYRSVVFYSDEDQKETAQKVTKEIEDSKIWGRPLVTEIVPLKAFYKAEEYHQDYFKRNPYQPYCQAIIAPKVAKFRKKYIDMLSNPVAAAQH
jgi:peptide-methionine (S)-S-oxide reductase